MKDFCKLVRAGDSLCVLSPNGYFFPKQAGVEITHLTENEAHTPKYDGKRLIKLKLTLFCIEELSKDYTFEELKKSV